MVLFLLKSVNLVEYYNKIESRRSSAKWIAELVDQIFRLTHLQWMYRNNYIHYCVSGDAETVDEYEARMARISKTLELTDPGELLEENRHLVEEYTLAELAEASTSTRITSRWCQLASQHSLSECEGLWRRQSVMIWKSCRHPSFDRPRNATNAVAHRRTNRAPKREDRKIEFVTSVT